MQNQLRWLTWLVTAQEAIKNSPAKHPDYTASCEWSIRDWVRHGIVTAYPCPNAQAGGHMGVLSEEFGFVQLDFATDFRPCCYAQLNSRTNEQRVILTNYLVWHPSFPHTLKCLKCEKAWVFPQDIKFATGRIKC